MSTTLRSQFPAGYLQSESPYILLSADSVFISEFQKGCSFDFKKLFIVGSGKYLESIIFWQFGLDRKAIPYFDVPSIVIIPLSVYPCISFNRAVRSFILISVVAYGRSRSYNFTVALTSPAFCFFIFFMNFLLNIFYNFFFIIFFISWNYQIKN